MFVMLLQQLTNGLMLGGTYALVAIGYSLVFGVLRLIHLAHGEVFMVGAYIGLEAMLELHVGPWPLWRPRSPARRCWGSFLK